MGLAISIHAPAKGATKKETGLMRVDQFQSTLPRRERLRNSNLGGVFIYFNPRSREGSDRLLSTSSVTGRISIHAPAKGATGSSAVGIRTTAFQSTLPRRERQFVSNWIDNVAIISIHAPAKGATKRRLTGCSTTRNFNPRSREGSDYRGNRR